MPNATDMVEIAEWLGQQRNNQFANSLCVFYTTRGYLTDRQIQAARNMRYASLTNQNQCLRPTVKKSGMFEVNGVVYKVIPSQSGRLYAKRLSPQTLSWVYERGAMAIIKESDRMTLDMARRYGALTGACCVCGRLLTDENSIANGIGPVCERTTNWR